MKTVLLALLLATSLAHAADPFLNTGPSFEDGNKLYQDCSSSTSHFQDGFCMGYIAAISDAADGLKNVDVCTPKGATMQEVVDVVKKYLTDYPGERHYSAFSIIITSLQIVFPCPKTQAATPSH